VVAILCAGCSCGDDAPVDGVYEGDFRGTFEATSPPEQGVAEGIRSRFSGTATVRVHHAGEGRLRFDVTDCTVEASVEDGDRAALEPLDEAACRLDVAGRIGVVDVRPESGTASFSEDGLELSYVGEVPSNEEGYPPARVTFVFDGARGEP